MRGGRGILLSQANATQPAIYHSLPAIINTADLVSSVGPWEISVLGRNPAVDGKLSS